MLISALLVLSSFAALAADGSPADEDITDRTNTDGSHWAGDTHWDKDFVAVNDGSLAVKGLEPGDTVNFYKVLEYDQTADKTVAQAVAATDSGSDWHAAGWKLIAPFNTGANALTKDEFIEMLTKGISSTLAGKIAKSATETATIANIEAEGNKGAASVTASDVEPGLYVALITPANAGVVYNPVFVSSDYYKNGTKSNEWEVTLANSYANVAMAKKSEITLDKEATEHAEDTYEQLPADSNANNDAKAVAVGDVIDFTVKTTIPEFANNYLNPLFVITDSLDTGLELDQSSIEVHAATVSGDAWNIGDKITSGFTIDPNGLCINY